MTFDPTFDYSTTDLTQENNLVLWEFGELIKSLVAISADAERQRQIVGSSEVAAAIVMDFECYFTHQRVSYVERGLLLRNQYILLKDLEHFLQEQEGSNNPDFWEDDLLATNRQWKTTRQQAKEILNALGMGNLILEFYREDRNEKSAKGEKQVVQTTKTRLVKK